MPVLRDLYSGSKKSTSAYLPAYSLSIAAQPLSCRPFGNLLHNPTIRVTIQAIQNDPCLVPETFAERSNLHG